MMSEECSMVKHRLHLVTIFQWNSDQNDWFVTCCVRNVRWWSIVYIRSRYFNGTLVKMIDLWHDVRKMFDSEALSTAHHNISTELWLEWFTCYMISQESSIVKHSLHLIKLFQQNSFQNDWFVTWCMRNVRWWSVVYIPSRYCNGTLLRIIALSHDVWVMFDSEALSTFHHDIATELSLKWLICHIICEECSIVNRCLQTITIFRWNANSNDWFVTWYAKNVWLWSIVYNPSRYFNGTLVRMIDLSHDVSGMFHGEALSTCDHDISTELWLQWFISHMMCEECSMVEHCLHLVQLFQRNFP